TPGARRGGLAEAAAGGRDRRLLRAPGRPRYVAGGDAQRLRRAGAQGDGSLPRRVQLSGRPVAGRAGAAGGAGLGALRGGAAALSADQMRELWKALEIRLSEEEMRILDEASAS